MITPEILEDALLIHSGIAISYAILFMYLKIKANDSPSDLPLLRSPHKMTSITPEHRHAISPTTGKEAYSQMDRVRQILTAGLFAIGMLPASDAVLAAYAVQVGAFLNPDNATQFAGSINAAGFAATTLPPVENTDRLTHVVVGPFPNQTTATATNQQLAAYSWHGYIRPWPAAAGSTTAGTGEPEQYAKKRPGEDRYIRYTDGNGLDLLIAEAPSDEMPPSSDIPIIEAPLAGSGQDVLVLEEGEESGPMIIDESTTGAGAEPAIDIGIEQQSDVMSPADVTTWTDQLHHRGDDFSIGLDEAWIEYGDFYRSQSLADSSNYGHLALSAEWSPDSDWEARLGGRLDWYRQTGEPNSNDVELDYGDSFIRYRGNNFRITTGTQKIIWGRIDELPPTDRISRVDLARGILDTLPERRRAMPVVRFEGFHEDYKLDAVWIPDFRKANLPDKDSVWYPINRENGTILGFESSPALQTFVRNGSISESAPSDNGNFGLRLSNTGTRIDYAMTIQHARQSTPYWELNPTVRNSFLAGNDPVTAIGSSTDATFKARYPRTWVAGGDLGFEALSATWRFEAAWISDTPVTRKDLRYDTVSSANWAAGVQFYPGDSDVRVNLQLAAINLIDSPSVLDRKNLYNFNGSLFNEFGNNRWRLNTRFFIGLDKKSIYLNPEITFIGWEPHEIYAGWHYFNGDEQTVGGYWEDSSMLTLGWRSHF